MKAALLIIFVIMRMGLSGQEERESVFGTFRGTQLINAQTTEAISPGSFDFTIKHRFGMIGIDSTSYQQFLGLDLPANIRFGFAIPLSKRLSLGIGRTKHGKTIDVEIKYLFIKQSEDGKIPLSAAFYFNPAVKTERFGNIPDYAFFTDSITAFENKFSHRLSYNSQLIIARKFSEKISFLISPAFIYRNLVTAGEMNHTIVVPFGGVIKTGVNSSIIFEYAYRFNNRPAQDAYPLSLAWEFGTVGHIFQIVISSSAELIEQDLYSKDSFNYLKGKFALGFNLRRTTWLEKRNKHDE